jgi:N-acetylglucosaminyldiphosphoundecaprenol N-acetyl-beta-D-mannosaminyltransferase
MNIQKQRTPPQTAAVSVGGIKFAPLSMSQSVDAVMESLRHPRLRPFSITAVNAHFVVTAERDARLHAYLNSADLCVADGSSILLSALAMGESLPERVTGIDLMVNLCREAAEENKSVYLLGGKPSAAAGAAKALSNMFPDLRIVGVDRPAIGSEFEPVEAERIRARIRAASPDLLFVCFGVPLQEYWIEKYALDLPVGAVMGNGAAFDVLAGFFVRPPAWVQKIGMEWFCRLVTEPRRLWRRYLIGNANFLSIVFRQAIFKR